MAANRKQATLIQFQDAGLVNRPYDNPLPISSKRSFKVAMSSSEEPLLAQPTTAGTDGQPWLSDQALTRYFFSDSPAPLSPRWIYHGIALALCAATAVMEHVWSDSVLGYWFGSSTNSFVELLQQGSLVFSPVVCAGALVAMLFSLGHEWQLRLASRPFALIPMGAMVFYLIVLAMSPTDFYTAWPSVLICVGVLGTATAFLCAPIPRTGSTLERESRAVVGSFGVAFLALLIVNPIVGSLLGDTVSSTILIWGVALLFHGWYVLFHSILMMPLPDCIRALMETTQPATAT